MNTMNTPERLISLTRCELNFFSLFILTTIHAYRTSNSRALIQAVLYGLMVEWIVYVGVEKYEPRLYDHDDSFNVMIGNTGIPLYIPILWSVFLYVSERTARRLGPQASNLIISLISITLAISLDTTLEPTAISHKYWVYRTEDPLNRLGPTWLKAPVVNILAWSVLQAGYSTSLRIFSKKKDLIIIKSILGVLVCLLGFYVLDVIRGIIGNEQDMNFFAVVLICCSGVFYSTVLKPFQQWNYSSTNDIDYYETYTINDCILIIIVMGWHSFNLLSLGWVETLSKGETFHDENDLWTLYVCGFVSFAAFALPTRKFRVPLPTINGGGTTRNINIDKKD